MNGFTGIVVVTFVIEEVNVLSLFFIPWPKVGIKKLCCIVSSYFCYDSMTL